MYIRYVSFILHTFFPFQTLFIIQEAVLDLLQPWNGGWGRLIESISSARKEAVPLGDEYLGLESFFDPKLLAAAPVSFVKYPLSYMVKSPLFAAVVG